MTSRPLAFSQSRPTLGEIRRESSSWTSIEMSRLQENLHIGIVLFTSNCSSCGSNRSHPVIQVYLYVISGLTIVNILGNIFAVVILSDRIWHKAVLTTILKGISYFEIVFNSLTFLSFFYQQNEPLGPFLPFGTTVVAAVEVALLLCDSLLVGFQIARNWSVTLLALFRYNMVCRSSTSGRHCTQVTVFSNDNLPKVFVLMLVVAVGVALPRLFEETPVICEHSAEICRYDPFYLSKTWFQYGYLGVLMFVVQSGGPIIVTSWVSALVIRKIQYRHRIRQRQGISSSNRFQKSQKNPGTLVLAVCITFLVLELPSFVSKIDFFVFDIGNPYLAPVANLLIYVDSSLNLLIYLISNKTFRKTSFNKIFCRNGSFGDRNECGNLTSSR